MRGSGDREEEGDVLTVRSPVRSPALWVLTFCLLTLLAFVNSAPTYTSYTL